MNYIFKTILFLYFVRKCFLQKADDNYYESEEDEETKPIGRDGETTTITTTPSSAATTSNGITTASDGTTAPSNGITTASDGTTAPSNGITTASDGTTAPSNGINTASNNTNTTSTVTTTTPRPTTTEFKVGNEDEVQKKFGYTDEQMSHLSDNAWASLESKNSETDQYKRDNVFNANEQYWAGFFLNLEMMRESASFIYHVGSSYQQILTCYYISITIKNAETDIRRYYKIRYLYANNLEYEVGYLIEEIIVHYQIAVELYHFMYKKYAMARVKFYAPTTYMLYMYTNILNQCKVVIELCNMLHELEAKYKNQGKTIFQDEKIVIKPDAKQKTFQIIEPIQQAEVQKKKRMKDRQKALKKAQKMFAKGEVAVKWQASTAKPKKRYNFSLHYGWSIEDW